MTEPEQWAVELLEAVFDACDLGSACGIVDCPQCASAALTIQRAFDEQTRELWEALAELRKWQAPSGQDPEIDAALARADRALATRQPTPTEGTSHDQ